MEVMLSFLLVVIFSVWVFHLKSEIGTLEQVMKAGLYASFHNDIPGNAESFVTRPVNGSSLKPTPAPQAAGLNGGRTTRKDGTPVWTIN